MTTKDYDDALIHLNSLQEEVRHNATQTANKILLDRRDKVASISKGAGFGVEQTDDIIVLPDKQSDPVEHAQDFFNYLKGVNPAAYEGASFDLGYTMPPAGGAGGAPGGRKMSAWHRQFKNNKRSRKSSKSQSRKRRSSKSQSRKRKASHDNCKKRKFVRARSKA